MSAGLSFRTSGARPMLQASATSAAQTLVARSGIRERLSLTCGNASAKPVHVFTSRSSSGRSTRGSLRSVTSRSSSRLGGWGSAQIGVEIQHKDRLLTDPGTIEDVRAVENDVVPFDRADVLEQGCVTAFLGDSPRSPRPRDLLGLPIGFETERSWPGVDKNGRINRRYMTRQ